ncbi:MAG: hypothetical protein A3E98_04260 [Candidatus Doudnabacteria bacterium RIFCSPHIGHO2_12_FULL_48_11]|uniref:Phosphoribosyltransferase domain-containing protein n=1 Tax=Candidatus Doudnabacteria bacterium RIFCSPHIGHO2_01_FULL_46_24 TaxID=1817825 RepID=A0A1F5NVE0_9BACT|nr:MAG: hypothetical protein A2720_00795 [Candidatus Doudnabacteria bacterium RIFCSPHIGHO2_01_FULL_46_24]OGE96006.1 MAG: hypothetical protein A3E98_04260 [Candidatus Doudnabacteria bacterium RIFCSPHIGHO2_12_FULL_48_11]
MSAALEQIRIEAERHQKFGPAWALMRELRVILDGHFWTHDMGHTGYYYTTLPLFLTGSIWTIVQELAAAIDASVKREITVVAGAQFGGNIIAQGLVNLISAAGPARTIHCIHIEKEFGLVGKDLGKTNYAIRDYFRDFLSGTRVLLVDDVRRSGRNMKLFEALLKDANASVVATASIIDASFVEHPGRHFSVWKAPEGDRYTPGPQTCPMCASGTPITKF